MPPAVHLVVARPRHQVPRRRPEVVGRNTQQRLELGDERVRDRLVRGRHVPRSTAS